MSDAPFCPSCWQGPELGAVAERVCTVPHPDNGAHAGLHVHRVKYLQQACQLASQTQNSRPESPSPAGYVLLKQQLQTLHHEFIAPLPDSTDYSQFTLRCVKLPHPKTPQTRLDRPQVSHCQALDWLRHSAAPSATCCRT